MLSLRFSYGTSELHGWPAELPLPPGVRVVSLHEGDAVIAAATAPEGDEDEPASPAPPEGGV